jgi:hypothetical protein
MSVSTKSKRNFSSFDLNEALIILRIEELIEWQVEAAPFEPTPFFMRECDGYATLTWSALNERRN